MRTKLNSETAGSNPVAPINRNKTIKQKTTREEAMSITTDRNKTSKLSDFLMSQEKFRPPVSQSVRSEPTPRDYIKKAAQHLQQALNSMHVAAIHHSTEDEVKEKLQKIMDAFSLDKSELERIIKFHYDRYPKDTSSDSIMESAQDS